MLQQTGKFSAGGRGGRNVTVFIFTDVVEATDSEGTDVDEGSKQLRLSDGSAVNRIRKGKYKVAQTGEVLTSSSPSAP